MDAAQPATNILLLGRSLGSGRHKFELTFGGVVVRRTYVLLMTFSEEISRMNGTETKSSDALDNCLLDGVLDFLEDLG